MELFAFILLVLGVAERVLNITDKTLDIIKKRFRQ